MEGWRKAIPESRDRLQSRVLVGLAGVPLVVACGPLILLMTVPQNVGYYALRAGIVSLTFGLIVWALRAATPAAAFFGTVVCLVVTFGTELHGVYPEGHSGLTPLMLLFILTFAAGRIGRAKKAATRREVEDVEDVREAKRGRSAAQVLANLGASPLLISATFVYVAPDILRVMMLAALAEATADTLSSELGSAFGGSPFLLTTFRRVAPGTDGAISLYGTLAGCFGAGLVVLAGVWAMQLSQRVFLVASASAVAGLFFDSLLGATVERRGWLGNDWVNFLSTVFAAAVALAIL